MNGLRVLRTTEGNIIHISNMEYFLMSIFFITMGFPAGSLIPYKSIVICLIGLYYYRHKIRIPYSLFIFMGGLVLVGILQIGKFGFSDLGSTFQLACAACVVATILGERFRYAYMNVLYVLCVISVFFYFAMALFNILPPDWFGMERILSVFVYNVRDNEIIRGRNCGPFWEPGAFAGYICVLFIMFFSKLPLLWKYHRKKVTWILVAFVTTFSTQGFVTMFCLLVFYYMSKKFNATDFMKMMLLLSCIVVLFMSVPMLGDKVFSQLEEAKDTESMEGSTSFSRFSTAMIDIYYIIKNPLSGNTKEIDIRYADHPYLKSYVEYVGGNGSGSGMTDFMANYGIIPMIIWTFFAYKSFKRENTGKGATLCIILLYMLGNCEIYFMWIGYYVFPFLVLKKQEKIIRQCKKSYIAKSGEILIN